MSEAGATAMLESDIASVDARLDELSMSVDDYWKRYQVLEPTHYTSGRRYEACEVVDAIILKAGLGPVESHRLAALLEYALRAGEKPICGDYEKGFDTDTDKAANYAHRLVYGEWLR